MYPVAYGSIDGPGYGRGDGRIVYEGLGLINTDIGRGGRLSSLKGFSLGV
jgi:hypothetical protein